MTIRRWPIYVAMEGDTPCGHQHQSKVQAVNCAENLSRRHPTRVYQVRRITRKGGESKPLHRAAGRLAPV